MSRIAQLGIAVLLLAVAVMGGLLVLRSRREIAGVKSENTVIAYAPCGLQGPLMAAKKLFSERHSEVRLDLVMDNANVLVRRILSKGERPDVFIAPGELELKQLRDRGLIDESTIRDYGSLDMVLIAPSGRHTVGALSDLDSPAVKFISMGDPKSTSLGYYGEQVLRGLGMWERLRPKVLLREAPLEAVTLVQSGRADAGLAYLTCPLDTNPEKASRSAVKIVEKIPRDIYPPVRLQLGMLKQCRVRDRAQVFIEFMASEEAQQVMARDGILPAKQAKK